MKPLRQAIEDYIKLRRSLGFWRNALAGKLRACWVVALNERWR